MYSVPSGYPVPRSEWREKRDGCPGCGKRFTFFTSKSNCPCCGDLFCSDCLQAEVTLSEGREPLPVCLNCFALIQDHRREAAKHMESRPGRTPPSSRLAATPRTPPKREVPAETPVSASLAQHAKTLTAESAALRQENARMIQTHAELTAALAQAHRTIAEKESATVQLQRVVKELQQRVEAREAGHGMSRTASSASFSPAPPSQGQSQSAYPAEPHTPLEAQMERKIALYERQLKDQEANQAQFAEDKARELAEQQRQRADLEGRVAHFESELREARDQLSAVKDVNKMLEEELHAATPADTTPDMIADLRNQLAALEVDKCRLTERVQALTEAASVTVTPEPALGVADDILHRAAVGSSASELLPETRWHQPSRVKPIAEALPTALSELAPSMPQAAGFLEWGGFDTVAVSEAVPCVLAHAARETADRWALFDPEQDDLRARFVHMAATLSANYASANPYHNAVHATDVLQGVVALTTSCTALFSHVTRVEKRAVAFAAMAHDVRHPGRSAPFLRQCFDPIHFTFNGVSPLEQLHTSTAMALLADEANDFTADLTNEEALAFHALVCEFILHTDMTRHDADVSAVGRRAWAAPFDYTKPEDRREVLGLLLHAADIGAQAKGVPIALKWLTVVEEMCQQGDDEAARGMPVSAGCQRGGPVEGGQMFFLTRFVFPIFDVVHQLFPEVTQPLANLRDLFDHYQHVTGRHDAFPESITHRSATDGQLADAQAQLDDALDALRSHKDKEPTQQLYIQTLKDAADSADEARRMLQTQIGRLESELAASDAHVTDLEARLAAISETTAEAEHAATGTAASHEAALQDLREALRQTHVQLDAVQKERDAALNAQQEAVPVTAADEEARVAELATLREEAELWKQRAEAMKARAADERAALEEARSSVAALTAANEDLQHQKTQLAAEAEAHEAKVQALESDLAAQQQSAADDRDKVAQTLSNSEEARVAELATLREEAELWKQQAEAMKARAAEEHATVTGLQTTVAKLREDAEARDAEVLKWQQQHASQQALLTKSHTQVADLSQMIQEERSASKEKVDQLEKTHQAERAQLMATLETAQQAVAAAGADVSRHTQERDDQRDDQRAEIAKLHEALASKDAQQQATLTQLKEKAAQLQTASHELKSREDSLHKEEARLTALKAAVEAAQAKSTKDHDVVQAMSARLKEASSVVTKEKAALEAARGAWEEQEEARSAQITPRVAALDARDAAAAQKAQHLVVREQALAEKLDALNAQVAQLEAREGRAAVLSEQLAIIAEKMNRQQRRLRLREARLNSLAADPRAHRSASASTASPSRPAEERAPSPTGLSDLSSGFSHGAAASTLHAALKNIRDAVERGTHPLVPLVVEDE